MSEHLSPEQIGRLSQYELHGEELLEALKHVEVCAECREQVQSPTKAEAVAQLFRDERRRHHQAVHPDLSKHHLSRFARLKKFLREKILGRFSILIH